MTRKIKLLLPLFLAVVLVSFYLLLGRSKSPLPQQLPVEEITGEQLVAKISDYNSQLLSASDPTQLLEIAKQRKNYLLDLIKENPDQAYSLFLSADQINSMPSQVRKYMENEISITGTLQVLHGDDFVNQKSTDQYSIYEPAQKQTYYLYHQKADNTTKPNGRLTAFPSGATVSLKGMAVANLIPIGKDVSQGTITKISDPPLNVLQNTIEIRKYLLLLVNFSDDTSQPIINAQPFRTVFDRADGIKAFYNEASYGRTNLDITFDDTWYTVAGNKPTFPDCWIIDPGDGTDIDLKDRLMEQALTRITTADGMYQGQPLSNFDGVILFFPDVACDSYGGHATFSKRTFNLDHPTGIQYNLHGVWLNAVGYEGNYPDGTTHEIGHNFSMWHAKTANCWDKTATNNELMGCDIREYGDQFDVMGGGYSVPIPDVGWHMDAYKKRFANTTIKWLNYDVNTKQIDMNIYTDPVEVDIYPLETPLIDGQYKMADIFYREISDDGDIGTVDYLIEYRRPTDAQIFDKSILNRQTGQPLTHNIFSGASIRMSRELGGYATYVLDTTPESQADDIANQDFLDAALTPDKSVTLPGGVKITTLSADDTKLRVKIEKVTALIPDPANWVYPASLVSSYKDNTGRCNLENPEKFLGVPDDDPVRLTHNQCYMEAVYDMGGLVRNDSGCSLNFWSSIPSGVAPTEPEYRVTDNLNTWPDASFGMLDEWQAGAVPYGSPTSFVKKTDSINKFAQGLSWRYIKMIYGGNGGSTGYWAGLAVPKSCFSPLPTPTPTINYPYKSFFPIILHE